MKTSGYIFLAILSIPLSLIKTQSIIDAGSLVPPELPETLDCQEKIYTFPVKQTDRNGKLCWDKISTIACWGRCDSMEVPDWRFPFKKSSHKVCVHYGRNRNVVSLRHCEDGALPEASYYEFIEAAGCKCQKCTSSDTSCEGIRGGPRGSQPSDFGFQ